MMCLNKSHFKISRIFKNVLSFISCNKTENFGGFQVEFFCLRKLEISEISEFSIWPLYKNWKLGELGNCFKTCNCFAGGS